MKATTTLFTISLILIGISCRKKVKDVEIQFILNGTASYCGQQDNFCPNELEVFSTGAKYVYDSPLDTAITNQYDWWNKRYIATLKILNNECECIYGHLEPLPGVEPALQKKPVVKITNIRLKE